VSNNRWTRHFIYRAECTKTTWKLRAVLVIGAIFCVQVTHSIWASAVGRSLVCSDQIQPAEAILVDHFDPNYLLFERAAALHNAGYGPRVISPISASSEPEGPNISDEIVHVMSRVARLDTLETIPVWEVEPISLNAAYQIKQFLTHEKITSVIIVTPGFRSRRSFLIYESVLGSSGIRLSCVPVFGLTSIANWTETWHGIEDVAQQFLKLQYYRLYILPMRKGTPTGQKSPVREKP
jgi:hypothetical protein